MKRRAAAMLLFSCVTLALVSCWSPVLDFVRHGYAVDRIE